jgi:ribosomal protein L37AE/L43A
LYEAGILLKKYRDKAVACPSCLSPAVSVKYLCVSCSSSNIEKRRIVQHRTCGFSDVEESFLKEGEYVCPKCKETLTKTGLQEAAVNFKCRECGESFEQPTWMHSCRKCKFNFTLNEASFIDVFSYVLNPDVKDELEGSTTSIAPFQRRLEELGFNVPPSTSLKGKSGGLQPFDIIAKGRVDGRDFVIALDMVWSSEPLDVVPVSTLMGKLIDTGANVGVLVAIPGISQAGKNLAELYDILVIEAENAKDAAEEFERRVKTILQRVK